MIEGIILWYLRRSVAQTRAAYGDIPCRLLLSIYLALKQKGESQAKSAMTKHYQTAMLFHHRATPNPQKKGAQETPRETDQVQQVLQLHCSSPQVSKPASLFQSQYSIELITYRSSLTRKKTRTTSTSTNSSTVPYTSIRLDLLSKYIPQRPQLPSRVTRLQLGWLLRSRRHSLLFHVTNITSCISYSYQGTYCGLAATHLLP